MGKCPQSSTSYNNNIGANKGEILMTVKEYLDKKTENKFVKTRINALRNLIDWSDNYSTSKRINALKQLRCKNA